MFRRILVTGGAGFIGSHVVDELLAGGYEVRVLDSLVPQVHGEGGGRPGHLAPEAELWVGELADRELLRRARRGVDGVVHLAARVGVGQSMYEIAEYTRANGLGTAALLEELGSEPVARLVVASSMSVYGEGLTEDAAGARREAPRRARAQLEAGRFELEDEGGRPLRPVPTPEDKAADLGVKVDGPPSPSGAGPWELEDLARDTLLPRRGLPPR